MCSVFWTLNSLWLCRYMFWISDNGQDTYSIDSAWMTGDNHKVFNRPSSSMCYSLASWVVWCFNNFHIFVGCIRHYKTGTFFIFFYPIIYFPHLTKWICFGCFDLHLVLVSINFKCFVFLKRTFLNMFWSGKIIFILGLALFHVQALISSLIHPSGLSVDYHMGHRLFWGDAKAGEISSMTYDGKNLVKIAEGVRPTSLDVFGG